jgi:hypothetical protein
VSGQTEVSFPAERGKEIHPRTTHASLTGHGARPYAPTTRESVNAARKPATVMSPAYSCAVSKASGTMVSDSMARMAPAATAVTNAMVAGLVSAKAP